jgi:hypothetical protein
MASWRPRNASSDLRSHAPSIRAPVRHHTITHPEEVKRRRGEGATRYPTKPKRARAGSGVHPVHGTWLSHRPPQFSSSSLPLAGSSVSRSGSAAGKGHNERGGSVTMHTRQLLIRPHHGQLTVIIITVGLVEVRLLAARAAPETAKIATKVLRVIQPVSLKPRHPSQGAGVLTMPPSRSPISKPGFVSSSSSST